MAPVQVLALREGSIDKIVMQKNSFVLPKLRINGDRSGLAARLFSGFVPYHAICRLKSRSAQRQYPVVHRLEPGFAGIEGVACDQFDAAKPAARKQAAHRAAMSAAEKAAPQAA